MKKLVALSTKEALLIQCALSDFAIKANSYLNCPDEYSCYFTDEILDDLDLCDNIRRKLSKVFSDLSVID